MELVTAARDLETMPEGRRRLYWVAGRTILPSRQHQEAQVYGTARPQAVSYVAMTMTGAGLALQYTVALWSCPSTDTCAPY